jgi:hypothetical protein
MLYNNVGAIRPVMRSIFGSDPYLMSRESALL